MRWGRSCGGVSRGGVEAPDGEMRLPPAASFQLLSGLCRSTIGVGDAVSSVGAALSPPLILFSETGSGSSIFLKREALRRTVWLSSAAVIAVPCASVTTMGLWLNVVDSLFYLLSFLMRTVSPTCKSV